MMGFLGRLLLWQKLALFGVLGVVLVAPPFAMYASFALTEISFLNEERAGMEPVRKLMRVVQLAQQHRGLSANVLGGNAGAEAARSTKQTETDAAITAFDALAQNAGFTPEMRQAWRKAAADWKSVAAAVAARSVEGKESFDRHTEMIGTLLRALDLAVDHYKLSLDPEPDSFHLIMGTLIHLPQLTEALGQARAKGSGALAKKEASIDERIVLSGQLGLAELHNGNMARAVGKSMELSPAVRDKLGAALQEAEKQQAAAIRLAREQVLQPARLEFSPNDYFASFTQAIDAQIKLMTQATDQLQDVLAARGQKLKTSWYTELVVLSALVILGLWLGIAVTHSITRPIGEAVRVAQALAQGDLTVQVKNAPQDEVGQLLTALGNTARQLEGIVSGIKDASEVIETAAQEIATGNADLSQRTEEQASSLEETASSMEELTSAVKQNAESARQANHLASGASDVAQRGGEVVHQVVTTMRSINESSTKIADIIGVIDGIAFQTNILALNAAVEAARAGEQGRGFAVVASEVRTLAKRSADAAKEIKRLITDSVDRVSHGTTLVDEAGGTMDEIVRSVKRVTEIMAEITAASEEQSTGIEQVNQAVTQMDEVTQQNAALVEQAAAAAESMQDQAEQLARAVSVFKVNHHAGVARQPANAEFMETSAPPRLAA